MLGYQDEAFDRFAISQALAFTSGDCRATAVGLLAGDVVSKVLFNVSAAISTITTLKAGLYDAGGNLVASSANVTANQPTGISSIALSASYTVPADGLYYLAVVLVATTMGSIGASTSVQSKADPIGSGGRGAITKTGQTDIPATLGTTQSNQPVWFGWA